MKLIGKLYDFFCTEKDIIVTFTIGRQYWKSLNKIDKERLLDISVNDKKKQRTLDQNAKLWALISLIDKHENGSEIPESENEIYTRLIRDAKIKVEYLEGLEQIKPYLEGDNKPFRVVEIFERRKSLKGADTCLFACYKGTSQFNTDEMSDFIGATLSYAEKVGIDTTYYVDELTLR